MFEVTILADDLRDDDDRGEDAICGLLDCERDRLWDRCLGLAELARRLSDLPLGDGDSTVARLDVLPLLIAADSLALDLRLAGESGMMGGSSRSRERPLSVEVLLCLGSVPAFEEERSGGRGRV